MPVTWKPPSVPGAAQFALWDGATFAYVTPTAFPDGRWRICIFPDGLDDGSGMEATAGNEGKAKAFVELWAAHNHARIAPAKDRHRMPHEGGNSTS